MSVSLVRCDDRLIHGQVIVRVLKTYSINKILLIDDETAKNPTMASIYRLSVPPGVKLVVHSLDDSDDAVEEALKDNANTLILLKNPQIALELFKRHPELPKEFNIGPMSNRKESKKATMYAYLMENEIQAIEELSNMGVRVYFRQVAEQDEIPWEKISNSLIGGKK